MNDLCSERPIGSPKSGWRFDDDNMCLSRVKSYRFVQFGITLVNGLFHNLKLDGSDLQDDGSTPMKFNTLIAGALEYQAAIGDQPHAARYLYRRIEIG